MNKKDLEFDYNNRKIKRRFTADWHNSGFINIERLPDLVQSLVSQQKEMMGYIEALHDKIDDLIVTNKICNIPSCHRAGCTSDHK